VEVVEYEQGQEIITEGDVGYEMFIVESGQCEAWKFGAVVHSYSEGDFFGERALLSREKRGASVVVSEAAASGRGNGCRLLRLSEQAYTLALRSKGVHDALAIASSAYSQLSHTSQKILRTATRFDRTVAGGGVSAVAGGLGKAAAKAGGAALRSARTLVADLEPGGGGGGSDGGGGGYTPEAAGSQRDDELCFKEFELLMHSELLRAHMDPASGGGGADGDWASRCAAIRKLRRAFDTADVDGNNELDEKELEIVLLSLDPSHEVKPEDVRRLWRTLNPDEEPVLSWTAFLRGMGRVRQDPVAMAVMDSGSPNHWELISLLIDTPCSRAESQRLQASLSYFERMGHKTLRASTSQQPREPEALRAVLRRACQGELRVLSAAQKQAISGHKQQVLLLAGAIAFATNLAPALFELALIYGLGTNGLSDIYTVCNNESWVALVVRRPWRPSV
jgi:hypothetical protein